MSPCSCRHGIHPIKLIAPERRRFVIIRTVALAGGAPAITRRLVHEALAFQPRDSLFSKPKRTAVRRRAGSGFGERKRVRVVMDMDDWEGWGGWNDLERIRPLPNMFSPGKSNGACTTAMR